VNGTAVDLTVVNQTAAADGGVTHGARLLAFTDAILRGDEAARTRERAALRAVLSAECFVEIAGLIAAFNVVDRVADATGIPLDTMMLTMSGDVRRQLNLARFASAANTPDASG